MFRKNNPLLRARLIAALASTISCAESESRECFTLMVHGKDGSLL